MQNRSISHFLSIPARSVILAITVLLAGPVLGQTTDNRQSDAGMVVGELHQALLDVMQNAKTLGYQGRFDRLYPVISSIFDTPLIVQVILSRYWKDLDELQQQNFIDLFRHLSVATYASRFDAFNGEHFNETARQELKKGRLLIKTELLRPNDSTVNLDYLMHEKDGKWYIISVIADGVNDLSLKRAEYASVIKDKGFEGLTGDIRTKIHDMENEVDD
jgi:phospholipid transport system substrate-binding protein